MLRTQKLLNTFGLYTILNGFLNTYWKMLLKDACWDHRPLDTDFFVVHMASLIQHFGLDISIRSIERDCHMLDPAQKAINLSINLIIWLGFPKRTPNFYCIKEKARLPPLPLFQCYFWADRHDMEITPECYHSHCFSPGCFNNTRKYFIHIHNKALEECTFHLCFWLTVLSILVFNDSPTGIAWVWGNKLRRVSNQRTQF